MPCSEHSFFLREYVDEENEGADETEQDLEEYPPAAKKAKLPGPAPDPESDLNLPPDLSLDEVEAVKKRLKFGSSVDRNFTAKIANPSGKLDLRYYKCNQTTLTVLVKSGVHQLLN